MTQISVFTLDPPEGENAPHALLEFLNDNKANDVQIDLSQSLSVSGHHLEVILSAYRQWRGAGQSFELTQVNPPLMERLVGIGTPAQLFSEGT